MIEINAVQKANLTAENLAAAINGKSLEEAKQELNAQFGTLFSLGMLNDFAEKFTSEEEVLKATEEAVLNVAGLQEHFQEEAYNGSQLKTAVDVKREQQKANLTAENLAAAINGKTGEAIREALKAQFGTLFTGENGPNSILRYIGYDEEKKVFEVTKEEILLIHVLNILGCFQEEAYNGSPLQTEIEAYEAIEAMCGAYNEAKNEATPTEKLETFLKVTCRKAELTDINPNLKAKGEKAFKVLDSKFGNNEITEADLKALSQDVTAWETIKAFLLAIVSLGLATSTRYEKNRYQDFVKAQKEAVLGGGVEV